MKMVLCALSRNSFHRLSQKPVFLAGGLRPGNVAEAIQRVSPFGVDLCSGVGMLGKLDPVKLERFMNGHDNFLSEIVWKRTSAHNRAKRYGPIHDTILFYSASNRHKWNRIYQAYDAEYLAAYYRHQDEHGRHRHSDLTGPGTRTGSSGKPWKGYDPTDAGRHWELPPDRSLPDRFNRPEGYSEMCVQDRLDILESQDLIYWPPKGKVPAFKRYASAMPGMPAQDIISDIGPAGGVEDKGYDTQKPLALLERIIEASTDEGDTVLDPFCGCATTLEAAHKLNRRWIGIDIAIQAIKRVAAVRLGERCKLKQGEDFVVDGVPRTLEGARDLWTRDKYHFQKWAVEEVDGFVTTRRTADGGIDGRIYFDVPSEPDLQSMVIEVKGGKNVTIADLRALRGVLEREDALMAGLIVMDKLPLQKQKNFHKWAAAAGDLDIKHAVRRYPRMQILSVPEILEGGRFQTPTPMGKTETGQKDWLT